MKQNTKISILGTGVTGTAVRERMANEPGYTIVDDPAEADLVIASPGIPPRNFPKVKAPIISEIELGYRLLPGVKIVAVTGTNGKTTTTTLISLMLDCPAAGNIGVPLISVQDRTLKYVSLEVSSYQLETIAEFKPFISVMLNLTPDHKERHPTMEIYAEAKARIFLNQDKNDHVIYNANDPLVKRIVEKNAKCRKVPIYPYKPLQQNILAAKAVARICGIPDQKVEEVLKNFKGVEHRIEEVAEIGGVIAYNDSKATNPESTMVALDKIERPIILIAGGRDKNTPLDDMARAMKHKVKHIVLIGEASDRFAQAFRDFPQTRAKTFAEAVDSAYAQAVPGDAVLLSPACASFDMFKNFEERGQQFKALVKQRVR
jgi:UDP-N-acetylmuramoylalanine--D-glutamate ligase